MKVTAAEVEQAKAKEGEVYLVELDEGGSGGEVHAALFRPVKAGEWARVRSMKGDVQKEPLMELTLVKAGLLAPGPEVLDLHLERYPAHIHILAQEVTKIAGSGAKASAKKV